jgi:hypothetical protein
MKKSIILGVLGLTACAAATYGQGFIALDNYSSAAHPTITSALQPAGITSGYTVGLYFALGTVAADAAAGNGLVNPLLALGSGQGATESFIGAAYPGEFVSSANFQATAATPGSGGTTVTLEVIAYNGASYANSTIRGHSAAFQIPALAGTAFPNFAGDYMSTFAVSAVPEPTTLALAGLGGLASLVALRRKQA